jgi:hypothetical protein
LQLSLRKATIRRLLERFLFGRNLAFAAILTAAALSSEGTGQSQDQQQNRSAAGNQTPAGPSSESILSAFDLSRILEKRAADALRRYLKDNQFLVTVEAEPIPLETKNLGVYVPQEISASAIANKSTAEISKKFAAKIVVKVSVIELPEETRASLQKIVETELSLQTSRGDSVELTTLDLKMPEEGKNPLQDELDRSQNEARNIRLEMERLNTQLALSKKDNDEIAQKQLQLQQKQQELAQKEKEIQDAEAKLAEQGRQDQAMRTFMVQIGALITALLIAVIILLGMRSLSSAIASAGGQLGEALKTLKPEAAVTHATEQIIESTVQSKEEIPDGQGAQSASSQQPAGDDDRLCPVAAKL